jgi:hypothetical protein
VALLELAMEKPCTIPSNPNSSKKFNSILMVVRFLLLTSLVDYDGDLFHRLVPEKIFSNLKWD